MANIVNQLPFIAYREYGLKDPKAQLFNRRLHVAKNLYRRDLMCHYGCVNAIEFSSDGELLISGGDDKRVMVWQFGQAIFDFGKPEPMKTGHQSNIFCLGITADKQRIYSGGNDDVVIVHDVQSKSTVEVLEHQRAVCCLAIDPFNNNVVSTAGNDGRLLLFDTRQSVHESLVISRSRKAFHGVCFHPQQVGLVVSANARDGIAMWDLRSPKYPVQHYLSTNGLCHNSMSVRFNQAGDHVLALRRRQCPVLYHVNNPEPVAEFQHPDYYNSCTMKSCCFAGNNDQYVLSGSDDFNLYMWQVPDEEEYLEIAGRPPHVVLYGHRSIVNQVRYNPRYCIIASSGVEKIIKLWSVMEYPQMKGTLLEEAHASENPRGLYSHEDYVEFVHHGGNGTLSSNQAEQTTSEDPRMMAFFDSLVQRELECLGEESDSLDGTSSASVPSRNSRNSDSSDPGNILVNFLPLPPKRAPQNVNRSQRCPNRLARLVAARYPNTVRTQKRGGPLRRSKQPRTSVNNAGNGTGASAKGARRGPRRATAPRTAQLPPARAARSAPSSERTDSDESAHRLFASCGRMSRPPRRRINVTRTYKRKNKTISSRKLITLRSNVPPPGGSSIGAFPHYSSFEDNLSMPSTSTGYRGQGNSLFRIAEVDSDDDQSGGSRPLSPRYTNGDHNGHSSINNVAATQQNNLMTEKCNTVNRSPPLHETRLRINVRRMRRNGRPNLHRSDSSESPPPKDFSERISAAIERLSPNVSYNRTVARLMNETNESEMESSCSTESSLWPAPGISTPDGGGGVGGVAGSSTRNSRLADNGSDDEVQALNFRQRVKKARRNYRSHIDSDSN